MILYDGIYVSAVWVSHYKINGTPVDFYAVMMWLPGDDFWYLEYSLRLQVDDLPPEISKDEVQSFAKRSREPFSPESEADLVAKTHQGFAEGLLPYGTKLLRYNISSNKLAEIMEIVGKIPSIHVLAGDGKKITTRNRLAE